MLELERTAPSALLALSRHTVARFQKVVKAAEAITLSLSDIPNAAFGDGLTPYAGHLVHNDRVTMIYEDGRQRWMCDILHPEGAVNCLAPDLTNPGLARAAALRAAGAVSMICDRAATITNSAVATITRTESETLAAKLRAKAGKSVSHLRVFTSKPWSTAMLREFRDRRWHNHSVDPSILSRSGCSLWITRSNGWVHLQLSPFSCLERPNETDQASEGQRNTDFPMI